MALSTSTTQQISSDDSIIINSSHRRVNRSASCDHFSNTGKKHCYITLYNHCSIFHVIALNLTTTALRNGPDNSVSNSMSTSSLSVTTSKFCFHFVFCTRLYGFE